MQLRLFDPKIYPFKIWIAILESEDEYANIQKTFQDQFEKDLVYTQWEKDCYAVTSEVKNRISRKNGVLIIFNMYNNAPRLEDISHESTHAAGSLFEYIGQDIKNDEPFAYMVGYIASCCGEVLNYN